jgi:hypothetical protein
MNKLIYILIITACLDLNCFVDTAKQSNSRVSITLISIDSVYTIAKQVLWQTQKYPPSPPQYYNANVYRITLNAYESPESSSPDSKLTIVCFYDHKHNDKFDLQPSEITRSPSGALTMSFPIEADKSGYVGFQVFTDQELDQQDWAYRYGDVNSSLKIYLQANTEQ